MQNIPIESHHLRELKSMLKDVYFFDELTVESIEAVCRALKLTPHKRREKIIREGEIGKAFHLIYSGSVRVYRGKTFFRRGQVIADLHQGEFFGEVALVRSNPRNATVICLEYSEIFTLTKTAFESIFENNKEFEEAIARIAHQRDSF